MSFINALLLAATTQAVTFTSVGTSAGGSTPTSTPPTSGPPTSGGGAGVVEGTCGSNTSGTWLFNRHGTGQSGLTSYNAYMGVSAEALTCGVLDYFTPEQMRDDSHCLFCDNLWSFPWSQYDSKYFFPKFSDAYNKNRAEKHQYKDYSQKNDNYIVGAYATEWSIYRAKGSYGFDHVPFNTAINYLLYAFLPICGQGADGIGQMALCTVNDCAAFGAGSSNPYFALNQQCVGLPDGTIVVHDPWSAFNAQFSGKQGSFHHLMNAKAEYGDKITIMPSVGGWSLSKLFFDMHNDKVRQNFLYSAANLLTAWPFFDGIDIDWEFPGGQGADAGTVKVVNAVSSIDLPAKNMGCNDVSDPHEDLDLWSSFATATSCQVSQVDTSVTTIKIPPVGCSASKEKRTKIADEFASWGELGLSKDDYINCDHCDIDIAQKLFTELRTVLDSIPVSQRPSKYRDTRRYQITTAISGDPNKINEVDYGYLVNSGALDHIFIMSYDFMGAWGGVGHQTNLYQQDMYEGFSVATSVQTLYDQGVPPEALVVGVASYGRGWKGAFNKSTNLQTIFNTTPTGPCKGDIEDGVVDYTTIINNTKNGSMVQVWDQCALAHITVGSSEAYTGDSVLSVFAKGKFVKDNGLAGLFTWELSQDYKEVPLINAMNEALGRVPSTGSATIPAGNLTSSCHVDVTPVAYANRTWTRPTCEN